MQNRYSRLNSRTINIAIIIQNQTQTEAVIQNIIKIVTTQTLGTDTILMIDQETHHIIKIELVQRIEIETVLIKDHKIIATIDRITTITNTDPVIISGIETSTSQTGRETTLSQHIEIYKFTLKLQK